MSETSVLVLSDIPEEKNTVEEITEQRVEEEQKLEADLKISSILAVPDKDSDNESVMSELSPVKPKRKKYNPKAAKTRKNMIRKLQELYAMTGKTQEEIRAMNLHRRRKASIQDLLKNEVQFQMDKVIEKKTGVPLTGTEEQKRLWCCDLLFRFDMTCCKLLERGVEFLPVNVSIDGFTRTFEESPQLQREVKDCFEEWIMSADQSWISEISGRSVWS